MRTYFLNKTILAVLLAQTERMKFIKLRDSHPLSTKLANPKLKYVFLLTCGSHALSLNSSAMKLIRSCVNLVIIYWVFELKENLNGKAKWQTVSGWCKQRKESFAYWSCHIEKDHIFNELIYLHSLLLFPLDTSSLSDSFILVKSCCALREFLHFSIAVQRGHTI